MKLLFHIHNHSWANKGRIPLFALLFLMFVAIFFLNNFFPLYADDFIYSFIDTKHLGERINSFPEIIASQYNHYHQWGGRSLVHAIAQILLWIPQTIADMLNSLAFVFYVYLVFSLSNGNKPITVNRFLLVSGLLWLALQSFITVAFWLTGSANYLWGTMIVLLFLSRYCQIYFQNKKDTWSITALYFFLGIIAGWTNENMFVAQIIFILGIFYLYKRNRSTIPKWAIAGLIGVCIGGITMLMAPGNFIRTETVIQSLGLNQDSVWELWTYKIGKVCYRYLVYILPLTLFYLITLFFFKRNVSESENRKKILSLSILFFVSAHGACFAMSASLIFPPRALFGIVSLLIIAIGVLTTEININEKKGLKNLFFALLIGYSIFFYLDLYCKLKYLSDQSKERLTLIEFEKAKGNKNITFTKKIELSDRYSYTDLSENAANDQNTSFARYYQIDSVRVISN